MAVFACHMLQPVQQQPAGVAQAMRASKVLWRAFIDLYCARLLRPVTPLQCSSRQPWRQCQPAMALTVSQQSQRWGLQAIAPAHVHPFNGHGDGIYQCQSTFMHQRRSLLGCHITANAQRNFSFYAAQIEYGLRCRGDGKALMHAVFGQWHMQQRGPAMGAARLPVARCAVCGPPVPGASQRTLHGACIGFIAQQKGHVGPVAHCLAQLARPPQCVGARVRVFVQIRRNLLPVRQHLVLILQLRRQAHGRGVGKRSRAAPAALGIVVFRHGAMMANFAFLCRESSTRSG